MRSASALVLLLPLADQAAAARVDSILDLEAASRYDHGERWCLTSDVTPGCTEEGTVLEINSAFTSSAWGRCGLPEGSGTRACKPDVTGWVRELCDGRRQCVVPPSAHPECTDFPQHSIRVTWSCVAGSASAEDMAVVARSGVVVDESVGGGSEAPEKDAGIADKPAGVVNEPVGRGGEVSKKESSEEHTVAGSRESEETEVEAPSCSGGPFEAETFFRQHRFATVCRDTKTGHFAKKACCERAISEHEGAMEACKAVPDKHCKPDLSTFASKRKKYTDVPIGYLCQRMYLCMQGDIAVGVAESVGKCGQQQLVAKKACVATKVQ